MKKKLKPLHVVLSENEYELSESFVKIRYNNKEWDYLPVIIKKYFGKELNCEGEDSETYHTEFYRFPKSWFEPEPEKEEWFEVVAHERGAISPKRWTSLVKDKEDFFSFGYKEDDFHWIELIPFKRGE